VNFSRSSFALLASLDLPTLTLPPRPIQRASPFITKHFIPYKVCCRALSFCFVESTDIEGLSCGASSAAEIVAMISSLLKNPIFRCDSPFSGMVA
jgi:hypothetical protein